MQTTVHAYHFDISVQNEKAAWEALRAKLAAWPHRMKSRSTGDNYHQTGRKLDGQTITLETAHLFNNQWNTGPIEGVTNEGLRVFDWAQDALFDYRGDPNRTIKQGYYLDQTPEMREIRRNTVACGYCAKQEPAAKGYVFCPHCLDFEFLKEADLPMTRMLPVEVDRFKTAQDIAELRRLKSNRARKKSTKALPPDPENQNDDRAEWAEAAIKAFIKVTRTDRGDALADLLCDLMHWADRNDEEATGNEEMQDFDQALARARMHYTEETMRSDDSPEETPIDPIHAAKHYMDKSDDPGHGPDSACEVCKFHLVHG